ncbi:MAG TPA: arylesterase [Saprospiraceae bacterium]|nr:arylesterase [Saprospiraceae bacterium]
MRLPALLPLALFLLFSCQNSSVPTEKNSGAKSGDSSAALAEPPARKSIVFFGNSLTAAYNLSPEQGFTALIQHKIDSLGLPYTCVNAGLSGETSADGKNRIGWVLQQPVDVFVLELGANDALRGLPLDATRSNLQAILDQVKVERPACKILVCGMLAPPNLGARYTNDFRDIFPALAKNNAAALVPFLLDGVAGIKGLNLEDGIHPNPQGQKIVAENVWAILRPLL